MTQNREIKAPHYRLYIDETGDHAYKNLDDVSRRYLGLLGVIFERANDYQKAADGLKKIKEKYWPKQDPDKPVIFHRVDMVNFRGYFSMFRDESARKNFDNDLINYVKNQQFVIINVVLDKKQHVARYRYPLNPYEYCLTAMLERYCGWLKRIKRDVGDVLAESRGGREDRQLKAVYKKIYHRGTSMRDVSFFQSALTSCEIKIKPKIINIAGLQIADLLAYPLKEKLFFEKNIRKSNFLGTFNEKIYQAVKDKYNRQFFTRRISGYGEVFIE